MTLLDVFFGHFRCYRKWTRDGWICIRGVWLRESWIPKEDWRPIQHPSYFTYLKCECGHEQKETGTENYEKIGKAKYCVNKTCPNCRRSMIQSHDY